MIEISKEEFMTVVWEVMKVSEPGIDPKNWGELAEDEKLGFMAGVNKMNDILRRKDPCLVGVHDWGVGNFLCGQHNAQTYQACNKCHLMRIAG